MEARRRGSLSSQFSADPVIDRGSERGRPVRMPQAVHVVVAVQHRLLDLPGIEDVRLQHRDIGGCRALRRLPLRPRRRLGFRRIGHADDRALPAALARELDPERVLVLEKRLERGDVGVDVAVDDRTVPASRAADAGLSRCRHQTLPGFAVRDGTGCPSSEIALLGRRISAVYPLTPPGCLRAAAAGPNGRTRRRAWRGRRRRPWGR